VRTVREYVQWALAAARVWNLSDGEARMLTAVAAHVNEAGECRASNERLAVLADRHVDTARRLLRRLKRLGLITTVHRHGKTTVRQLCTDRHPAEQLELQLGAPGGRGWALRRPGSPASRNKCSGGRSGARSPWALRRPPEGT
jgi:hypothetical protein